MASIIMPTTAELENMTSREIFARGVQYFKVKDYRLLSYDDHHVHAEVSGTHLYHVKLWYPNQQKLHYQCTCPHYADGYFCKHCVAVGLAWQQVQQEDLAENPTDNKKATQETPWQQIEAYLKQQTPTKLTQLLLNAARTHADIYQELLLLSTSTQPTDKLKSTLKKAIKQAINPLKQSGFEGWVSDEDCQAIDRILAKLEDILHEHARLVMELALDIYNQLYDLLGAVDDSNGELGARIETTTELHYQACLITMPEPMALAETLFNYEIQNDIGFYDTVVKYQTILGDIGIKHFRQLAEAAWQKYLDNRRNTQTSRQKSPRFVAISEFTNHMATNITMPTVESVSPPFALKHIMETLADQAGDIEALVAIKSVNLTSAYDYLSIATIYQEAQQAQKALQWAEQGLAAFPKRTDSRLRLFLVEHYLNSQPQRALELVWLNFTDHVCLDTYQSLEKLAKHVDCWPQERQRALEHIQKTKQQQARSINSAHTDASLLIEIALYEQDLVQAITYYAQGICLNINIALDLANKITNLYPEKAIGVYKQLVQQQVAATNNQAYAEAEKLLILIRPIYLQLGQPSAFSDYIAELTVTYKPKRNFMKILKQLSSHKG